MTILVTGGAGYIGSVTVERLATIGESIVVLDDLSYGHREAIDAGIPFYQGSAGDRGLLADIVKEHGIDSCMHFAASAFVAESVEKPALYFENNVQQGISLLNALVDAGVRRFIFSSSCTVYGEVKRIPTGASLSGFKIGRDRQKRNRLGLCDFRASDRIAARLELHA
jgi:UDP-glucose 4-epimerase